MSASQPLPQLWLLSDARNDARLEHALAGLPAGSGFVFRHYHLGGGERRARFDRLAACARAAGHCVILSGAQELARDWGADGSYGMAQMTGEQRGMLRLATAHDAEDLRHAAAAGADGVFLSPVFPTRSHPAAPALGIARFHALARLSAVPVIALGGMNRERAGELGWPRWGAIDGLAWPQRA